MTAIGLRLLLEFLGVPPSKIPPSKYIKASFGLGMPFADCKTGQFIFQNGV